MVFCTAQEIYERLITNNLTNNQGEITFNFLDISIKIKGRNAIGDLLQEWFAEWLINKNIEFRIPENTQKFPDFLLDTNSDTKNLLEIKTFNSSETPAFDIANFEAYCRSLKTHSYRLNTDYLIFGYELNDGNFAIRNIWLKKIWEITGASKTYPIKCQVKQDTIYNIRPVTWYAKNPVFPPFNNKKKFLIALYNTLIKYNKTSSLNIDWLEIVEENYLFYTGERI